MALMHDIRNDAPGMLRAEALGIVIKFDRTGPTTGRISWNIPPTIDGCAATTRAYNGIVVTLDTTSNNTTKLPTNGTVYTADATADQHLFAGDSIKTSKVVGAFYDDVHTTFFDVTGLIEHTPYFISGFPVDAQLRYYREGVHAYSLEFKQDGTSPTCGTQVVVFNPSAHNGVGGAVVSDDTGLLPTSTYTFTIQRGLVPKPNRPVGSQECVPVPFSYTVTVDGSSATTFGDLLVAINNKLQIIDNPPIGTTPPNTNAFYYNNDTNTLYQWNGFTHVIQPIIHQTHVPGNSNPGTYWFDAVTSNLKIRDVSSWKDVLVIDYRSNPETTDTSTCYWYRGDAVYLWKGSAWAKQPTYQQDVDPSLFKSAPYGSFWYNTSSYALYTWSAVLDMWVSTNAVQHSEPPNALSAGTKWFDDTNKKLFSRDTIQHIWVEERTARILETEPTVGVIASTLWYNPASLVLKVRNDSNTEWQDVNVIVYPSDPTGAKHWWNTATDDMHVLDDAAGVWSVVNTFYQQSTDPTMPPMFSEGDIWFNTQTHAMYFWRNGCFMLVEEYISYPTDPRTTLPAGVVWHNTSTDEWWVKTNQGWTPIVVTVSSTDLTSLDIGTLWYNPMHQALQMWNGMAWIAVLYSTRSLTPTVGSLWFDTVNAQLKEWDGQGWTRATPVITAELNCYGNMIFTDTAPGSLSWVQITDIDLFGSLSVDVRVDLPKPGTDGASSEPLYEEIGVGTDGTNGERLKLISEIRYSLGYPAVDVELHQEQLNMAIDIALQTLREHSSIAYSRGFFFLQVHSETQRYLLTNKVSGMNKIVEVLGIHRLTSSFLSSAHGAGVYGQIVMQHLYNMGTFDLLSYHIMSEYTKTLEMLFAGRITYTWNEQTRELHLHHRFPFAEKLCLVEASVERSEQQLLSDRICRPWLRKWATAEAMMMLANSRGKFSSLPGASGSVQLNASDLRQQSIADKELCMSEIFDFVVDTPEEWGLMSTIAVG